MQRAVPCQSLWLSIAAFIQEVLSKIRVGFSKKVVQLGQTRHLCKANFPRHHCLWQTTGLLLTLLLCCSSHPHAPQHPSFVCRPGSNGEGLQRGMGYCAKEEQDGIREYEGSSADRSLTVYQDLPAHLRLCLSKTEGPHANPVSHFLSRPRGSRGLGHHHPGHCPAPLFLTQRNPVQEGNVCISIQMLVVWTFPFTA